MGREDQDVNHKLATGDHPDLGLEGLVFEGGEEGLLNSIFKSGLEVPAPVPV